ncbi:hypothetical protein AB0442_31255 [Kitasatospora sp. NPDC085895]|uniref:hypothetical protein n=1 Tax=Kitasatospora sp. NPDC085895 TaxID=3155057 RepID=UPI00344C4163
MHARPADVISAHWTYEFAPAAARSGLPAFVTAHDAPLRCAWEEGLSPYRWLRDSLALPAVHRATALSGVSPGPPPRCTVRGMSAGPPPGRPPPAPAPPYSARMRTAEFAERYLSGLELWGDDFGPAQIEEWFADEREAYADLGAASSGSEAYGYGGFNRQYGFRRPPDRRFPRALGVGSAFGGEFLPVLDRIDDITTAPD